MVCQFTQIFIQSSLQKKLSFSKYKIGIYELNLNRVRIEFEWSSIRIRIEFESNSNQDVYTCKTDNVVAFFLSWVNSWVAELCLALVSSMVICNSAWVFVTAFNSSSIASIWDLKSLMSSSLGKICCLRFSKNGKIRIFLQLLKM